MAASRVKELLDELASTLAELGMLEEGDAAEAPETAMEGDEAPEGERSAVAAVEARQAKYDDLLMILLSRTSKLISINLL